MVISAFRYLDSVSFPANLVNSVGARHDTCGERQELIIIILCIIIALLLVLTIISYSLYCISNVFNHHNISFPPTIVIYLFRSVKPFQIESFVIVMREHRL